MKLQPESPSTKKRRTPATQASPSVPDLVPPPPDDGLRRDDRGVQSFRRLGHVAATKPPAPATAAASARDVAPQRLAGPDAALRRAGDAAVGGDAPEADARVFGQGLPSRPADGVQSAEPERAAHISRAACATRRCTTMTRRSCARAGATFGSTASARASRTRRFHLLTQEVYAEWVCDRCLSSKSIPLVKFKP
ncbi:hypothetical protein MRX96_017764 [Rhipicephalus microplus]